MTVPRLSHHLLQGSAPAAPARFAPWAGAVITVGASLYGDDWDDADLAKSDCTLSDREATVTAMYRAAHPDLARRADNAENWRRVVGTSHRVGVPKTEGDREAIRSSLAVEVSAAREAISSSLPSLSDLKAQNDARKSMLEAAQAALADAVLNSRIAGFWHREGSASLPAELPLGQFMAANASARYGLHTLGCIVRDRVKWHVYVDAEQLAEEFPLRATSIQTVDSISMDNLSPYLRLMIAVAVKQGITSGNHSTVESLKADLLADAPNFGLTAGSGNGGFDLSPTWAEEIAKAIRWPVARLGKAKGGNQRA